MWTVAGARGLAGEYLGEMGSRWEHVQAVGQRAGELHQAGLVDEEVAVAAWLHDIGYAPDLVDTGFHPLDGAQFLRKAGAPVRVVALVAAHTGASWEARERGLHARWAALPTPHEDDLDVVTLLDLVTGPTGRAVDPVARLDEVLRRYPVGHLVHRAVSASRPALLLAVERARRRLLLPDDWPLPGGVVQPTDAGT